MWLAARQRSTRTRLTRASRPPHTPRTCHTPTHTHTSTPAAFLASVYAGPASIAQAALLLERGGSPLAATHAAPPGTPALHTYRRYSGDSRLCTYCSTCGWEITGAAPPPHSTPLSLAYAAANQPYFELLQLQPVAAPESGSGGGGSGGADSAWQGPRCPGWSSQKEAALAGAADGLVWALASGGEAQAGQEGGLLLLGCLRAPLGLALPSGRLQDAVLAACKGSNQAVVLGLLSLSGCSLQAVERRGVLTTALLEALCSLGQSRKPEKGGEPQLSIVRGLLAQGVDVNFHRPGSATGSTALAWAAQDGAWEVVDALLAAGAHAASATLCCVPLRPGYDPEDLAIVGGPTVLMLACAHARSCSREQGRGQELASALARVRVLCSGGADVRAEESSRVSRVRGEDGSEQLIPQPLRVWDHASGNYARGLPPGGDCVGQPDRDSQLLRLLAELGGAPEGWEPSQEGLQGALQGGGGGAPPREGV